MIIEEAELLKKLKERHVTIEEIASIVYEIQHNYVFIDMDDCIDAVNTVLKKREVQMTALFAMQLDIFAEKGLFEEPLNTLICRDKGLFGLDEVLAVGIANLYGSIGFTNFGYLDKIKPGLVGKLNICAKDGEEVTTFIDDLVCAIAAAAAAKLAHSKKPKTKIAIFSSLGIEDEENTTIDAPGSNFEESEETTESEDASKHVKVLDDIDVIPDYEGD